MISEERRLFYTRPRPTENDLRNLLWGASLPDHACEVLLPACDALVAVRATHDEPSQLELRLHRVELRHVLVGLYYEPVVLGEHLVGDPHRFSELLLGRLCKPDVVSLRGAHLVAVRAEEERSRQDELRLEPVGLHHVAAC